jgi:hypothetical protein
LETVKKKDDGVPNLKNTAYKMGLELNKFQQSMREMHNSSIENGKWVKFKKSGEIVYQIRDDFFAHGKAILNNSEEIENTFIELNKAYSMYGANLKRYIFLDKNRSNEEHMQEYVNEISELASKLSTDLFYSIEQRTEDLRARTKSNI